MTPMPVNPTVVIFIDEGGVVAGIASNIAPLPELNVKVVHNQADFEDESAGKPFVSR